jgi:hypothetical protein
LELLVHGFLGNLLLGLWWGSTSLWEHMVEEPAHLMASAKIREEGAGVHLLSMVSHAGEPCP